MRTKKILICLSALFLLGAGGYAQQKPSFASQTYAGITIGDSDTELQLQTINGLKWKKWFGGIGIGIDWYYLRSVPVFASVNRNLFQKGKRSLFISGDAGINIPWQQEYLYTLYEVDKEQYSGLYWATGFGYKFGVGKADNSILLHLGYSYKRMEEKVKNDFPCLVGPCPDYISSYDYRLKRLSIKVGWGF